MISEILQKRLLQALEGLVRVACRAGDILIYGVGDTLDEATRQHGKTLTTYVTVETLQRKVHPTQLGESGFNSATTGLHGTSANCTGFEARPK